MAHEMREESINVYLFSQCETWTQIPQQNTGLNQDDFVCRIHWRGLPQQSGYRSDSQLYIRYESLRIHGHERFVIDRD
jgi:hypothetical protein